MKKKSIIALLILFLLLVVFVPFSNTAFVIAGDSETLTTEKERVGSCPVSVEMTEVSSLFFCYKRHFSVTIDGHSINSFQSNSYSEADGLCVQSQMYYDDVSNAMSLCRLIYPSDLSYIIIGFDSNYYYLDNGANLSVDELPLS